MRPGQKRKVKEINLLKVDKKSYGSKIMMINKVFNIVYDRFPPPNVTDSNPPIGSYFKFCTPLRVVRKGRDMIFPLKATNF
jgi:hypothetical protein